MNATVKQMVCPDCARMNGQEHAEGCPSGFPPGTWLGEYGEGWDAAKNALLPPLAAEIERRTTRFEGRFMLVPCILEGGSPIVTVRIDVATFEATATCSVPWPDEVILDPAFGEAMR